MNVDKLLAAAEVLGGLIERFSELPEEKRKSVEAALQLSITQSYLVELASHLRAGMDPYDAMLETAKGTLLIG